MDYNKIVEKVRDVVAEHLGIEAYEIDPEKAIYHSTSGMVIATPRGDDLGADSLDIAEIALGVEEAFEIDIPDSDLEGINSVASMARYIQERLEADAA